MAEEKKSSVGLLRLTARSMQDSSFAFYLAFTGVIIQFIHNLLAVAGTFNLFVIDEHWLLFAFEWMIALSIAAIFAATLFFFTLKAGSIKKPQGNAGNDKLETYRKERSKYKQIVSGFSIFDTLLDFYFWIYIVFMGSNIGGVTQLWQTIDERGILLIVIIPIVVMLPQTLRFYSEEVKLENWLEDEKRKGSKKQKGNKK